MDSYASSEAAIYETAPRRSWSLPEASASRLSVYLEPAKHVRHERGNWYASNASGWLRLTFKKGVPVGRWIKISYKCSFLDRLVRPVMRFVSAEGSIDHSMAAALFGQATWIGRIPAGTTSVLISPVDRAGPFGFEITDFSVASRLGLLAKSFASAKMNTAMAVGARIIGARQELEQMIKFAMAGVDFENYHEMRAERLRPFERSGIDRPRMNWRYGPEIRLVVRVATAWDKRLAELVAFMQRQPYPRWSIGVVIGRQGGRDARLPIRLHPAARSGRLHLLRPGSSAADLTAGLKKSDMLSVFNLDDRLNDYSIAVVAERAIVNEGKTVLYGDEDRTTKVGRFVDPCLKPDWSPIFEARQPYVGNDFFMRPSFIAGKRLTAEAILRGAARKLLQKEAPERIGHIRRILVTRAPKPVFAKKQANLLQVAQQTTLETKSALTAEVPGIKPSFMEPRESEKRLARLAQRKPSFVQHGKPVASIIIPTKDQSHLLAACVEGLRNRTALGNFEAIIVDNGSVEPQTFQLYERLKSDARFKVLSRPGPFNFSNLCNEAARHAKADILVFMNNDIAMIDDAWLKPLIDLAEQPEIGAVGAKLLFPSGKLQHAGVVVGMGGFADHIHRNDEPNSPGYLARLSVPHEISAVTGACVAVEARKFWAIEGFDGKNLPVELNDIDLCLRLNERGWKTIFTPESVLVHHQSASRGFSVKPFTRYQKERVYFRARWASLLRDDPYFNPALSLFSVKPMLG